MEYDSTIADAIRAVRDGGVLLYPTHTLWGLGGDATRDDVAQRIRKLKGQVSSRPFLVLVGGDGDVAMLVDDIPDKAQRIMRHLWPGPLTLLLPARSGLPAGIVGREGLVGVRLAMHPVAQSIVAGVKGPLISTSANPTGVPPPAAFGNVAPEILAGVDAVVRGSPPPNGVQSTIVAITTAGRMTLVREGATAWAEVKQCL